MFYLLMMSQWWVKKKSMICQYDPPIIDNTTGPKASLYIHWFIINLPTSRKFYDKLDGIYHRSIDMFLVCLYVSPWIPLVFPMAGVRLLSSLILRPSTWPKGLHGHLGHPKKTAGETWKTMRKIDEKPGNPNRIDQKNLEKFRFWGFWWIFVIAKKSEHVTSNIEIGTTWTCLTHTCDLIHNDTSNIDMISICNHWDMMGIWLMNWLVVAGIFHVHWSSSYLVWWS